MTCNWDDLEGKTGTIHIGRDIADGIQTKVVMFIAGDIHYVIAEYQTFYISKEYEEFKNTVDALWLKHKSKIKPIKKLMSKKTFVDKNVKCNILIYDENNRRDIDATVKVILDSLNGKFYEDDSQIWEIHIQQNLSKDDPCVIVNIWEAKRYKGNL